MMFFYLDFRTGYFYGRLRLNVVALRTQKELPNPWKTGCIVVDCSTTVETTVSYHPAENLV